MPVLVVGGPSNVGKTTAASALAKELGYRLLSVDEIARASTHSALAFERDELTWQQAPDTLCGLLIRKGEALWPEIRGQIDASLAHGGTTVIEGEGPFPDALSQLMDVADVRSAFIVERGASRLHRTLWSRSERFRTLPASQRSNVVEMNLRYGEWLVEECNRTGVPWVPSQPWSELPSRLATALGAPT